MRYDSIIKSIVFKLHYNDVTMSTMASQITSLTIVYSTVYSGADQRKHRSSTSLAFVRGIHRWPANSPHREIVSIWWRHHVLHRIEGRAMAVKLLWMPQYLTSKKSTLVRVMPWCHQITSHYVSQCWHKSLSPYGVTWPQWFHWAEVGVFHMIPA